MTICENFRGIAVTDYRDGKGMVRLRCKKWDCEYCAKANQSMWRNHLLSKMPPLAPYWTMLTVTCMGENHRNHTTLKALMDNFDKLMKRLKREYGSFEYVRVYEQHKSEEFHMHLLCGFRTITLPFEWITDKEGRRKYVGIHHQRITRHSVEVGLGEQCAVSPLEGTLGEKSAAIHAVRYISKYLTKGIGANMPKGTRRIQTSQKIGSPKPTSKLEWTMKSGVYIDDVAREKWYDMNLTKEITFDDFLESHVYPDEYVDNDNI